MGLGTYQNFYAQSGGNNMNGGSSNSNAAAYGSTNGNWNGTTIYTPTDGSTPASSVNVGDYASVFVDGATTPVFIARVTAVAAGVNGAITISGTNQAGTPPSSSATARSINVGGAWSIPSGTNGYPLLPLTGFANCKDGSGNMPAINFHCSGTGAIDSAITSGITNNVAGPYVMRAYNVTPGDGDPATNGDTQANQINYKFRIDGSTNAITLLALSGTTGIIFQDFVFSNNGTTGNGTGMTVNCSGAVIQRCIAHDLRGLGFNATSASNILIECEAYNCNTSNTANSGGFNCGGAQGVLFDRCTSHHHTGSNASGFVASGSNCCPIFLNCEGDDNGFCGLLDVTSGGSACIRVLGGGYDNNASDGTRMNRSAGTGATYIENCNFEGNGQSSGTGYAINHVDSLAYGIFINNPRTWNNKTAAFNGIAGVDADVIAAITGSATAYNSASNGNFQLTGTDAATAVNAGRGFFTQTKTGYSGSLGFPDVGAVESQNTGGGTTIIVSHHVVNEFVPEGFY